LPEKKISDTNALAYFIVTPFTKKASFIELTPGQLFNGRRVSRGCHLTNNDPRKMSRFLRMNIS
jgi:hypothetical protein